MMWDEPEFLTREEEEDMTDKVDTPDEWDDFMPVGGPDPNHPCPKCGATPMAPGDGSGRHCARCGWLWMIGRPGGKYSPVETGEGPCPH